MSARRVTHWIGWTALVAAAGCGGGGSRPPLDPRLTLGTVDFLVDADALASSVRLEDRFFPATHCAVVEGLVSEAGVRRLIRFDTVIANLGEHHAIIGDPANPVEPFTPADFEYSPCHGHYHFLGYADNELRDAGGASIGIGHKQAFCLLDSVQVVETRRSLGFDCEFQGISSGWADSYVSILDGQWVDVTGLPEGDYTLIVSVNPTGAFPESPDVHANVASVIVHVPDPNGPPQ